MNVKTICLIAALAALVTTGCSRKPAPSADDRPAAPPALPAPAASPSVVGKWLTPTGGSIEFRADGSATMAGPAGSREMRYRLPDERTIEISRPGGAATIRWQVVSLAAQELVVTDADGAEVRLRRSG